MFSCDTDQHSREHNASAARTDVPDCSSVWAAQLFTVRLLDLARPQISPGQPMTMADVIGKAAQRLPPSGAFPMPGSSTPRSPEPRYRSGSL
jgi:hypothetical protein